ncbi:ABC transporter substrate-binding protein [Shimia sp. R9_3]|uniref:ABC transporter substrate-binding protein n=1 Tax=Shimia sp. R9_3 TaxID=2821113 RepID=UPI001ADB4644|nr:ABC transporter substrate-binding protein [Shimia sp. R9_3]MBO9401342.1 ABC transporter substrate-binding protein [Shimia sp. R9_3]
MSILKPIAFGALLAFGMSAAASAEINVNMHYLKVERELPPTLSNLDPVPEDLGVSGAEVALKDNATTGRFLGHDYALETTEVYLGEDPLASAKQALETTPLLLIDAPAEIVMAIADLPEAQSALLFNVAAPDNPLRRENCRRNVLHTAPSLAMRTDALAQFFVKRRWDRLALIEGTYAQDQAYANALRESLTKFGLELRSTKTWAFDADMRRNAAQEVPLFTQELKDHDVLLVADEIHDFSRYIAFNTWEPRPIAGSEGMTATAWAPVVEQWGAAQLQSRFEKTAEREMLPRDYAAWAAVRAIGEAVTRTSSADLQTLRTFILSPEFELAGFKGRPLSFRPWNGQLRQPIPLTHPRALVAMAPLEGFLHPVSELDTLGQDQPETTCTAFE